MDIFLDTAHLPSIKTWASTGLITGITTNPSHLAKEGHEPTAAVKEMCMLLPHASISVEVTQEKPEEVYKQAKKIAAIADNIVVKIPCHRDYYAVIHRLVKENVRINVTLVFTLIQGMLMCKLGVQYISPFVGRLDDSGADGIGVVRELRDMINKYGYFGTKLLAASIRSVEHVHQSIIAGADIVTLPIAIMEKMTQHPLTDTGMKKFLADWQKLNVDTFPL